MRLNLLVHTSANVHILLRVRFLSADVLFHYCSCNNMAKALHTLTGLIIAFSLLQAYYNNTEHFFPFIWCDRYTDDFGCTSYFTELNPEMCQLQLIINLLILYNSLMISFVSCFLKLHPLLCTYLHQDQPLKACLA